MIISDPDQSLKQARTYLTKIRSKFKQLSTLFQSGNDNYLIPAQYKDAVKSLKQIKSHMHAILACTNIMLSLSPTDQLSIINIKALIDKHLNEKLIPLIEREDAAQHQTIRRELLWLELQLNEIHRRLFGMEPLSHAKRKSLSKSVPDQSENWQDILINTLMRLPVTETYQGRTSLLKGISDNLNRDPGNKRLDLTIIIDQLDQLGQLNSGQSPLLQLIDRAFPYASDFEVGQNLQKVRNTLEDRHKVN